MDNLTVLKDIIAFLPEWRALVPQGIMLKQMVGITNRVFKVSHSQNGILPASVIYRVFGSEAENPFLNRELESHIVEEIGKTGVGPRIYGSTKVYRLEEFVPNNELPAKSMLNEGTLLKVPFLVKESVFVRMCKETKPFQKAETKMSQIELFSEQELVQLDELRNWLHPDELKWISERLPFLDQRLVLSHNDLLANNILVRTSDSELQFIDFEYAAYNFRVYDIANYFNEALFDYDVFEPPYYRVSTALPDLKRLRRFVEYYALANKVSKVELLNHIGNQQELADMITQHGVQSEVTKLIQDVPLCLMLSDLYWGAWAISVSKNPRINFDYISFAYVRMKQYKQVKLAFFQNKD